MPLKNIETQGPYLLREGTIATTTEKVRIPVGKPPTRPPAFLRDKNKDRGMPITKWPTPFWLPPNSAVTIEEKGEEKGKRGGRREGKEQSCLCLLNLVMPKVHPRPHPLVDE